LTAGRRKPYFNNDDNILELILVNCEDPKNSFFPVSMGIFDWKNLIKLPTIPK
jgi:hypothetical protein